MGEWRNRQTRMVEGHVPARGWGFKSPFAHQEDPGMPSGLIGGTDHGALQLVVSIRDRFATLPGRPLGRQRTESADRGGTAGQGKS
jgi:hypothetical protein